MRGENKLLIMCVRFRVLLSGRNGAGTAWTWSWEKAGLKLCWDICISQQNITLLTLINKCWMDVTVDPP